MASILDLLAWRNISASVQKVETGIPNRLPPAFFSLTENVMGDRTTFVTTRGQRQTAKRVEYGGASRPRTLRPLGEQTMTLLTFAEHVKIRQELWLRLRQHNDLMAQKLAQEEIARAGRDARQVFDNGRVAAVTMMLSKGKIWYDSAGNLLPTSSSAFVTVDYGVGANNLNQLNGIIAEPWSDPTADVIQHIENLKVQMRQNTGRELKNAFYGKNIANYLVKNVTLKNYWAFNTEMHKAFHANPGAVPKGFAGLDWHPMGDAFFEDQNETVQAIWDGDQVTFCPEVTRNAYTFFEGLMTVPKRFGISADLQGAVADFDEVYGIGGYAVPEIDPPGAKQVYFDCFLPAWKNPLDLFIADCAF